MKVERLLGLLTQPDGVYELDNYIVVKQDTDLSISDSNNFTISRTMRQGNVRLASKENSLELYLPSIDSIDYTDEQLNKIASIIKDDVQTNLQLALLRLSAVNYPMPSISSLMRLSEMTKGVGTGDSGVLTLKFSQYGGNGGMNSSSQSQNSGFFQMMSGAANETFNRWQAINPYEPMLETRRGTATYTWDKAIEQNLADDSNSGHVTKDKDKRDYSLTHEQRVYYQNLARLKRKFEDDKKQKESEEANKPERIRLDEPFNPVHHLELEDRLERQRGKDKLQYRPRKERHNGLLPDWYEKLQEYRRTHFPLLKKASYERPKANMLGDGGQPPGHGALSGAGSGDSEKDPYARFKPTGYDRSLPPTPDRKGFPGEGEDIMADPFTPGFNRGNEPRGKVEEDFRANPYAADETIMGWREKELKNPTSPQFLPNTGQVQLEKPEPETPNDLASSDANDSIEEQLQKLEELLNKGKRKLKETPGRKRWPDGAQQEYDKQDRDPEEYGSKTISTWVSPNMFNGAI